MLAAGGPLSVKEGAASTSTSLRSSGRQRLEGVREANKVFVDVTFSNADHGFFYDARASDHPAAAAQAWSLTQAFLDTYCQR